MTGFTVVCILISWLNQKPADLVLQGFQNRIYPDLAGQSLSLSLSQLHLVPSYVKVRVTGSTVLF